MNPNEPTLMPDESLEELDLDAVASVDDFIKELEAKEKDLHITADLQIEVSDSEYDPRSTPDFLPADIAPVRAASQADHQPRGNEPGLKTRVYELENEVDTLNKRMAALRAERNEVQEKSDRRLKDFENYKYRMDRERRGAFIDQISNLANQMLPVLDNLDRAMEALERSDAEKSDEFQQFFDGIALVHQQVNEVFAEMGVQPIATVGEPFDPNFHEAVATEERTDVPGNTVTQEMLRGYRIGNRVIRHSMVKVTLGPQPARQAAETTESSPSYGDPTFETPSSDELPDLDPPDNNENDEAPAE